MFKIRPLSARFLSALLLAAGILTVTSCYTDTPKVDMAVPANKSIDVGINSFISITFNRDILFRSGGILDAVKLARLDDGAPITLTLAGTEGNTFILQPSAALDHNTEYRGTVTCDNIYGVTEGEEFNMARDFTWRFTTAAAPAPEIQVRQEGAIIKSGGTYDFDSIPEGSGSGDKTFTVHNFGDADLVLDSITLLGIDADQFSLNVSALSFPVIVGAGESIDFTASFNPGSMGEKSALIAIANNDTTGDENPCVFTLLGNGADADIPVITSFVLTSPSPATSNIIKFTLTGTDNVGVYAWLINESAVPPTADDPAWLRRKPSSYILSPGSGVKNVYAWAKDLAGNVSASRHVTVNFDGSIPVITAFTLTSANPSPVREITFTLTGSDDMEITGWMVKETSATPAPDAPGWLADAPSGYTLSAAYGLKSVYAWAKDANGNLSARAKISVEYTSSSEVGRYMTWGSGGDGIYGTDDDVMTGYYQFTYDGTDRMMAQYSGPGTNGTWFDGDDVVAMYEKVVDAGDYYGYLMYSGPGTNGTWFDGDDVLNTTPGSMTGYRLAKNNSVLMTGFFMKSSGPGPDGVWFTSDDPITGYSWMETDDYDNPVAQFSSDSAGLDGVWGTGDDHLTGASSVTVDGNKRIILMTSYSGPGPDSNWRTFNDNVVSSKSGMVYDAAGRTYRMVSYNASNVVTSYTEYRYLADGKIASFYMYSGPGPDTLWFTYDDVCSGYMTYEYVAQ
jgi:hypothetical protein